MITLIFFRLDSHFHELGFVNNSALGDREDNINYKK
jgi:hypothetical protein